MSEAAPFASHDLRERLRFRILAEIDVAEARTEARKMAERCGYSPSAAYRFATAVSELASNLVFHARNGGEIALAAPTAAGAPLECIATDDGPGIADLALAMTDGYSSSGSLGCGLPGTRRLVDDFEMTSSPEAGTRVRCGMRRR